MRLKRPDKKSEKAALLSEQQALEKQLQGTEDPAAELSLAVPLLVRRVRHASCMYICGEGTNWPPEAAAWPGTQRLKAKLIRVRLCCRRCTTVL